MSDLLQIPRNGDGAPQADVIFVHGLGGDAFTTWQHDTNTPEDCWPYWLAQERSDLAIHTLDYGASPSRWLGPSMPLYDRAREVLTHLQTRKINELRLGDLPIMFVAHSLGGLVVKALLEQAHSRSAAEPSWAKILGATKAVIFVATPHVGAGIAKWADRFGWLFRASAALRGLRGHREDLRDLQEWYSLNSRDLGIRTEAFYETAPTNVLCLLAPRLAKVPWISRLPTTVKVVEEADANPGAPGVLVRSHDGDHLSICKPIARTDTICAFVCDVIDACLSGQRGLEPARAFRAAASSVTVAAPAVADIAVIADSLALPADLSDFQDRGDKQAKLLAALTKPGQAAAVTALGGMGGIGKTVLAVHAAHQLKDRCPDGVRYLDLKGISHELEGVASKPLTSIEAMGRVIQSFDETARIPEDLDRVGTLYRNTLDGKRVLLLLDNAGDSEQVRPLLDPRNRGAATIIVTSRRTITADGLTPIQLDQMSPEEARVFLAEMIGLDRASNEELDRLFARCGYLPLALRVAGRFLQDHPDWTVTEYVDAVNNAEVEFDIEDEKNKDVFAVLGLSAEQLAKEDPSLAARWQVLVVFSDSFDRQAVAAMWAMEERKTRADLSALVRRSMLLFDAATGRYRLHDLMRDVARLPFEGEDQALVDQRLEEAAVRHARHYCGVLAAAHELYLKGGESVLGGLALYDLEQRNIAAGQVWAVRRIEVSDDAARLAADYAGDSVLGLRLHPRSHVKDWLSPRLLACRKIGDRSGEGRALGSLGHAYFALGDTRRAREHYQQALTIMREIGDRQGEGTALGALGVAYAALGEPRRAIERYEQHLAIAREIGDRRGEGGALGNLGIAYADLGEPRRAIEHYEQHLAIAREVGNRWDEGGALGNLGLAHAALSETRRAIEHHEQSLAITREIGDRRGESMALGNLGLAYNSLGEQRRAIEYFEQQLPIARETGERRGEGNAVGGLGNAYYRLGDLRRAIEHYERSLAIKREIGDRHGEGNELFNSAAAFDQLGERAEAIGRMEEALRIYEHIEDPNASRARAILAEWRGEGGG